MGKLEEYLEKSGTRLRVPYTAVEQALHRSGFLCPEGWCSYSRELTDITGNALLVVYGTADGTLFIGKPRSRNTGARTYMARAPEPVRRAQDPDTFMQWLNRETGRWFNFGKRKGKYMGKLSRYLEESGTRLKLPYTEVEKALHGAGFSCGEDSCVWSREFTGRDGDVLLAAYSTLHGTLFTGKAGKAGPAAKMRMSRISEDMARTDSRAVFMSWLDGELESRL